ncbi:MAG: class I SAM-dependent methyltransferase [Halanaerobiales bacterium]|nr:class I SAM-dependent methyltransferase [Halanaerobiales bacterium]
MKQILEYYRNYDEEGRLMRSPAHQMEFITTTHVINKLIQVNDRIIEIGAGTGRYSFYYAEKGFEVSAVELVPENVAIMRKKLSKKYAGSLRLMITQGDARDLSIFPAESFELALCLGPIYHLPDPAEKEKAIREGLRVLKPGGVLAVAYINKFAVYLSTLIDEGGFKNPTILKNILNHGATYLDDCDCFYFTTPEEMEDLMEKFDIEPITQVATDGVNYFGIVNKLPADELPFWIENHLATCEQPSLLGYSLHGLYLCRKSKDC